MLTYRKQFIQNAFCAEIALKVNGMMVFNSNEGKEKSNMMKKKYPLFLIILLALSGACKLDSPNEVIIDNIMDIYFINSLEEDLLDSAGSGRFYPDSIHVYNVIRGVKNEVDNRTDYPHNFFIYKNDFAGKNALRLFIEVDTTILQLNKNSSDTITCVFDRSQTLFVIRKVWYNGDLKWDDYATNREFTILK
jgi:hypothetical protein